MCSRSEIERVIKKHFTFSLATKDSINLKEYEALFPDQKPNECDPHKKKLADARNLGKPKLTEDSGFRFKCNFCQKPFKDLLSLRRHKAKIHKSLPQGYKIFKHKFSQSYFLKLQQIMDHAKVEEDKQRSSANETHNLVTTGVNDNIHGRKIYSAKQFNEENVDSGDYPERNQLNWENSPKSSKNIDSEAAVPKTEETLLAAHPVAICKECESSCASFKHLCIHYSTQHKLPNVALTRLNNHDFNRYRRNYERIVTGSKTIVNFDVDSRNKLSTGQNLKRRKSSVKQQRHFECNMCQKRYTEKHSLKRHKLVVHEGFRYKCDRCEKDFSHSKNLRWHILAVHKGFRYKCDRCELDFSQPKNLRRHILAVHEGFRYKCDRCEQDFSYAVSLRRHMLTVHGKMRYECNECQSKFTQKSDLNRHKLTIHTGVSFKCNVCRKDFSSSSSLSRHKRKH